MENTATYLFDASCWKLQVALNSDKEATLKLALLTWLFRPATFWGRRNKPPDTQPQAELLSGRQYMTAVVAGSSQQ